LFLLSLVFVFRLSYAEGRCDVFAILCRCFVPRHALMRASDAAIDTAGHFIALAVD